MQEKHLLTVEQRHQLLAFTRFGSEDEAFYSVSSFLHCCWRLVESAADFPSHPAPCCWLAQLQTQAELTNLSIIWQTSTLLIDKRESNVLWIQLLKCDVYLLFFLVLNWNLDCWLDKTSHFLYFLTFYRQQLGLLTILLIILSINPQKISKKCTMWRLRPAVHRCSVCL